MEYHSQKNASGSRGVSLTNPVVKVKVTSHGGPCKVHQVKHSYGRHRVGGGREFDFLMAGAGSIQTEPVFVAPDLMISPMPRLLGGFPARETTRELLCIPR